MRKNLTRFLLILLIPFVLFLSEAFAQGPMGGGPIGGAGGGTGAADILAVGNCLGGNCFDGTSDGGTWSRWYDGDSHYLELNPGNLVANMTFDPTDYSGTGPWTRAHSPTFQVTLFTPQMSLVGSDASPDEPGEMRYDSVVAAYDGGAYTWFDDDEVRIILDTDTEPTAGEDGYAWKYSDALKKNVLSPDLDTGGATAYENIGDPGGAGSIAFGANTGTYTSGTEAWGGIIIESTDADNAGDTTLLTLKHDDDYDENSIFLQLINDADGGADVLFKVTGLGVYLGAGSPDQTMTGDDFFVSGFFECDGPIYADGGIVSTDTDPKITLDDSEGADGFWAVQAADANDAVATFGVDDSNGDDQPYIELDGVNEQTEFKYVIVPEGGTKALTPVTDSTADFAANFTGANLYGGTFVANADDGDLQLPVMAVGMNFCVITLGAIEVVADTNAADGYLMDGTTGTEGKNLTNLSAAGDIACFQYYTADDWLITTNGWTPE